MVTGTAQIGTGFGNFHAFVWDQANGMRDLGTIAGDSSSGEFINANGHIVGNSTVNNFDNRSHAFIYDTAIHDLGSLGSDGYESDRSGAFGINIHDEVVGSSYRPFTGGALYQVAFVYRDGTMFDLETSVDNRDYRLYSAVSINDAGQILVQAIHVPTNTNRAVLLTPAGVPDSSPTPTPSPTATATATATPSATATATPNPVATPSPTATPPASPTPFSSASPSGTPASSPVPTATPTFTPTATASPSVSATPSAAPSVGAQPLNIATRGRVGTGDNAMIGGFIISGNAAKKVIVRAIGPSLRASLAGALSDPVLQLRGPDGSLIRQNDNWRDDAAQASAIEANNVAPADELESALVETLAPGSYTAAVTGKNGASGVGLIEVYDLEQGASKLANISTRGVVESAQNVLIGGFILGGTENSTQVLLRAIGPSLTNVGVANALSNPTLELRDGNGVLLLANDDWKDEQQTAIEQTGISPNDPTESAILADLPPGAYTAIVAGKDGAAGTGLIEIYNLR
jgi:probable HAF family extracellular repeat protein